MPGVVTNGITSITKTQGGTTRYLSFRFLTLTKLYTHLLATCHFTSLPLLSFIHTYLFPVVPLDYQSRDLHTIGRLVRQTDDDAGWLRRKHLKEAEGGI